MPKYFMPVGNTDFREIRETGLYYIDKTMLIDQLKIIISKLYNAHKYLIGNGNALEDYEIEKFKALLSALPSEVYLKDSLNFLSKLLFDYHKKML